MDTTIFDDKLFFYFRNKYKPETIQYLKEKHYYELKNDLPSVTKRINLYMWNGFLIREITLLGYTYEHLANQYNQFFERIGKMSSLKEMQSFEINMFSRYIDIIIDLQESTDHLLVNKILHYLHMHIEDETNLKDLTEALSISQSHASHIFKEQMKISIIKYSKQLKVERAKSLLKSEESITAIGEKLGFYDQSHFYRTFKNLTGQSPREFRLHHKPIKKESL